MRQLNDNDRSMRPDPARSAVSHAPGWAPGLRQLYDRVATEPLPGDFADLLAHLQRR